MEIICHQNLHVLIRFQKNYIIFIFLIFVLKLNMRTKAGATCSNTVVQHLLI